MPKKHYTDERLQGGCSSKLNTKLPEVCLASEQASNIKESEDALHKGGLDHGG